MSKIVEIIARELNLEVANVAGAVNLLDDGATVPFVSRYRKEATGGLNDEQLQSIDQRLRYYHDLEKRRAAILKSIESQDKLTPELAAKINACYDATALEDLYLPFKPKRKTRATVARERGLEPLATFIMAMDPQAKVRRRAQQFVGDDVPDVDAAIDGALDIIAEQVSENPRAREAVRLHYRRDAVLRSHFIKGKEIEGRNFEAYYEFTRPLKHVQPHQLLAIRRGEALGYLRVSIDVPEQRATDSIARVMIKQPRGESAALVREAIDDAFKRLINPSIENEFAARAKRHADEVSISNFSTNVRQLLMSPPLGHKRILAIDPGMRTGCKVVCLDRSGNLLAHDVIYPNSPHNDVEGASETLRRLIEAHDIEAIALGNGTGSRETERFLKKMRMPRHIDVHTVSEDGASIYSASAVAREEFPDEDVTVRGAVSIGRRLLDPLAELIKIDPKSLGVGQYQHDVDQGMLGEALEYVVEGCVNSVGVDVNTASPQLLQYVSGLGPVLARNIVDYRREHGSFASRRELLKVPKLGPKTYTLAAGFLRVPGAANPLDNSAVHPERYAVVESMARDTGCTVAQLMADKTLRDAIDINRYVTADVGLPTLRDIMAELDKPGRDPRSKIVSVEFDENVTRIEDVAVGMVLNGIVTNVTNFGAFVNIGVHNDGLIHANRGPNGQSEYHIGQPVSVRVVKVDLERGRITLARHRSGTL
ncbi:MAG: RNA-binding transcriptional accessory protein [Muribaculaceae bacterium]|nr:RNA-binding transcriptional accessory protein [Muribaculaceae bacterium]